MTPAEFKKKWARYSGKETSAYQEHFNDLCALLRHPTPAAADPRFELPVALARFRPWPIVTLPAGEWCRTASRNG